MKFTKHLVVMAMLGVVLSSAVGCTTLSVENMGTSYGDADIDRSEYIAENPVESKEMEDLISEAEAAAKSMGAYVPSSQKNKEKEIKEKKAKIQTKIQSFLANYPDVELDKTLPDTDISDDAFTWINGVINESSTTQDAEALPGNISSIGEEPVVIGGDSTIEEVTTASTEESVNTSEQTTTTETSTESMRGTMTD